MDIKLRTFIIIFICSFLMGCAGIGPRILPYSSHAFNTAVLRSTEEQMLLNIVRMQFGDRPYYLTISNITSSNTLSLGSSPSVSYSKSVTRRPRSSSWSISPTLPGNISYSDSPTIIYSPMETQKFVTAMVSAISLQSAFLLLDSGWSISRVFRIVFKRIGHMENAENAGRPSSRSIPIYKEFVNFAHYANKLQHMGYISIASVKEADDTALVMVIRKPHTPEVRRLFNMLRIKKEFPVIIFKRGYTHEPEDNVVTVETRSFISTMYYLSKSVEVYPWEIATGIVVFPKLPNGRFFPWRAVTHGMMVIHSSPVWRPDASVQVRYKHRWFWIADNDSDSKEALAMVQQLFLLTAGANATQSPLISYNLNK